MISIRKATAADAALLTPLARTTFIESHGHSAGAEDIATYVGEKYTEAVLTTELTAPENLYHLLYYNDQPAGFTKILLNTPPEGVSEMAITKLERIYLLKEYYDLKLGSVLLNFNIDLAKQNGQKGIWLYVWTENHRAVRFYRRNGFEVIGHFDFPISPTHTNPNYRMLLQW